MEFLIVLIAVIFATLALREPIKRWPIVFYLLAIAAVAILLVGSSGLFGAWWKAVIVLVQRCQVALALFAVVMFIGVLPQGSKLDCWLRPIRAELSIIACILCIGHMLMYLSVFASRISSGSLLANVAASLTVAAVLFALVVLLGVTSFDSVKRKMSASTWKRIQKTAYLFFGLIYIHVIFVLAPAALHGGERAFGSLIAYSVLFASYAILKLRSSFAPQKRAQPPHSATQHRKRTAPTLNP